MSNTIKKIYSKDEIADMLKQLGVPRFGIDCCIQHDTTVIVCNHCKGAGYYYKEELVNYHKHDYADIWYSCHKCNGEGRLTQTTTTVPFLNSRHVPPKITTVPFSENPITRDTQERIEWRLSLDKLVGNI